MAWIEVHQPLPNHPKTFHLAELLGLKDTDVAWAKLVRLWLWAFDYCKDGKLVVAGRPLTNSQIAKAANWDGDADAFVSAMKEAGWIDEGERGVLEIHDWHEYAGATLKKLRSDQERKRLIRACSSNNSDTELGVLSSGRPADVQRTSDGRPADVQRTSSGHPADVQRTNQPTNQHTNQGGDTGEGVQGERGHAGAICGATPPSDPPPPPFLASPERQERPAGIAPPARRRDETAPDDPNVVPHDLVASGGKSAGPEADALAALEVASCYRRYDPTVPENSALAHIRQAMASGVDPERAKFAICKRAPAGDKIWEILDDLRIEARRRRRLETERRVQEESSRRRLSEEEARRRHEEAVERVDRILSELPDETLRAWRAEAERQAEEARVIGFARPSFIRSVLRVRAAREFGVEGV